MIVSENWLRDIVNPNWNIDELCDALSLAGLEVDGYELSAPDFHSVVIGEIIAAEPHPQADKLQITQVNVGGDEPLQIICGASNARQGIRVACALAGAELPGNFKIKKSKIRGVVSNGMLASSKELGLGTEHEGILELDALAPIGKDYREYLNQDDYCIDIDLTPNRGDCLSMRGIAREVAAISGLQVQAFTPQGTVISSAHSITVDSRVPELCPVFCGCVVEGFDITATSPEWLEDKLKKSGIAPISLLVDITNYVMLELGQPMHAFDFNKVKGNIHLRLAEADEKITLLNDETLSLNTDNLLVCDDAGAIALAGIMGGQHTAVQTQTTAVLFEAAHFTPDAIRGKARAFNMQTDASFRFERGVDPKLPPIAMQRAVALLTSIAGGQAGVVTHFQHSADIGQRPTIALVETEITRVLGVDIVKEEVEQKLEALGCMLQFDASTNSWQVTPPSWRFDLEIEVDLIEELIRLVGFQHLSSQGEDMNATLHIPPLPEDQRPTALLKDRLINLGFYEAITYSFVNEHTQQLLSPEVGTISLANPISEDLKVMRTSILPGLLGALSHNLNRQIKHLKLFEIGLCFDNTDGLKQEYKLGGAITGQWIQEHWATHTRRTDFYDARGVVEQLFAGALPALALSFHAVEKTPLHPGKAAEVKVKGVSVGYVGQLHPKTQSDLGLNQEVYVFEIDLSALRQGQVPDYQAISAFPEIRRDIALVMAEEVPAQRVIDYIYQAGVKWLRSAQIFDTYTGDELPVNHKSIACSLVFQDNLTTLKDEQVEKQIRKLLQKLESDMQVKLR